MSIAVVNEHIEQNGITVYFFFIIHSRFCLTGDRIFELTNTFCKTYTYSTPQLRVQRVSLSLFQEVVIKKRTVTPFLSLGELMTGLQVSSYSCALDRRHPGMFISFETASFLFSHNRADFGKRLCNSDFGINEHLISEKTNGFNVI